MFIATLVVIIFVVVLALVVRKQNIENQKRVKELVFLSACGNEEAERALEKANLSPQEYSQLLETALREKAENGNSVAARLLGTRFYTEGDFKQAYKWYRRAAEAGDLPAMHQLAEDRFAERCGMNPEESFKRKRGKLAWMDRFSVLPFLCVFVLQRELDGADGFNAPCVYGSPKLPRNRESPLRSRGVCFIK